MNPTKAFDKLVEKYPQVYGSNPEYNYFLEEFMDFVKKGKLLDLGCGAGIPVTSYLVKHGYDVVGVDASKKMIEAAKKNVPQAEFIHEDMTDLELEPESFDGACALFSLTHLKKKALPKFIEKVHSTLKDNGALLIGVYEGSSEGKGKLLGEQTYISQFSEDDLKILLKDFKIQLMEKRDFQPENDDARKQIFLIATKRNMELEEIEEEEELEIKAPHMPEPQDEADEETPDIFKSDGSSEIHAGNQEGFIQVDDLKEIAKEMEHEAFITIDHLKELISRKHETKKEKESTRDAEKTEEKARPSKKKSSTKLVVETKEEEEEEPKIKITLFKTKKKKNSEEPED